MAETTGSGRRKTANLSPSVCTASGPSLIGRPLRAWTPDPRAPIGMRLAKARPAAVQGTIFQNGNVYEDGLGAMWEKRNAFWTDRAAHEQEVRQGHLSLELTRARHIGSEADTFAVPAPYFSIPN